MDKLTAERQNEETRKVIRNMVLAQQNPQLVIRRAQREMAAVVLVGLCAILGIAFVVILVIASAFNR